jgi:general secretion pathway protein E
MIIVTGPTGSGKTTTLYTMLSMLNNSTRKIITLEDPVEYEIPGIQQSQINVKK